MKLLVGLGNPGTEYENTRHNVGFVVLEAFRKKYFPAEEWKFEKKFNSQVICFKDTPSSKEYPLLLVKPQTFMNSSGEAVLKVSKYHKITPENVLVVHDDLDLPLGQFRLQKGKSAAGHHGVASVINALGTQDFWRLRVGTDSPLREKAKSDGDFVLAKFSKGELSLLGKVIKEIMTPLTKITHRVCERECC